MPIESPFIRLFMVLKIVCGFVILFIAPLLEALKFPLARAISGLIPVSVNSSRKGNFKRLNALKCALEYFPATVGERKTPSKRLKFRRGFAVTRNNPVLAVCLNTVAAPVNAASLIKCLT